MPEYERIDLQFALGKAYEDLKQHERSFRHLLAGNKLKRAQIHYDEAEAMGYTQRIRAIFDAALCRAKAGGGEPAPTPVFIVGMPRSGTTLIEQIIASHPKAVGAGELFDFDNIVQSLTGLNGGALSFPEVVATMSGEQLRQVGARYLAAVRALAPTAERVADKMPWKLHFPGLIHLALPNARIIHARRDPVDTCLSCFSILFEGAGNPFTYDLGELSRFYRAYDFLMAHWRAVLPPGLMLEVRYEEVVGELEKQARSIIAHCGLEWDDSCLAFHATRRPVRTSSVAQVRKPIYHSSVGRWRPYRDQLRPLFEELGIDWRMNSARSAPPSPVAVAGRIQPAITGPEIHQTPTTDAPRPAQLRQLLKISGGACPGRRDHDKVDSSGGRGSGAAVGCCAGPSTEFRSRSGNASAHAARSGICRPHEGHYHPALARSRSQRGLLPLLAVHGTAFDADRERICAIRRQHHWHHQLLARARFYTTQSKRPCAVCCQSHSAAPGPPLKTNNQ